jgi:hypothetical protein
MQKQTMAPSLARFTTKVLIAPGARPVASTATVAWQSGCGTGRWTTALKICSSAVSPSLRRKMRPIVDFRHFRTTI